MDFTLSTGFAKDERVTVATLYWEAFGAKLGRVMGPAPKALAFITKHLNPAFAVVARAQDNTILGVAGFKTAKGALIGGEFRDLAHAYGWMSALWRTPFLVLLERTLEDGVLLMDGICVTSEARECGVGSALLSGIIGLADKQGLLRVRLDVIDTNPRAKALYVRKGFIEAGHRDLGPLRWVFGFQRATELHFHISNAETAT